MLSLFLLSIFGSVLLINGQTVVNSKLITTV